MRTRDSRRHRPWSLNDPANPYEQDECRVCGKDKPCIDRICDDCEEATDE